MPKILNNIDDLITETNKISTPITLLLETDISENVKYHIENSLNLTSSIYRFGSEKYLELVNEVRNLYQNKNVQLNDIDKFIVTETNIGELSSYNDNIIPLDIPFIYEVSKEPPHQLDKPFRTPGHPRKKYAVYTKNDKGNVVLVRFGDPLRSVKNCDPVRARLFLRRHHCESPGPKWKPKWWSCNVGKFSKELGLQCSDPW